MPGRFRYSRWDGSQSGFELDAEGVLDVEELLGHYAEELRRTGQEGEADRVLGLSSDPAAHFVMSIPEQQQTDPSVSTE